MLRIARRRRLPSDTVRPFWDGRQPTTPGRSAADDEGRACVAATQRGGDRGEPGDRRGDRAAVPCPRRQGRDDRPQRGTSGRRSWHGRGHARHRGDRRCLRPDRGGARTGGRPGGQRRHHPRPAADADDGRGVRRRHRHQPHGHVPLRAAGLEEHDPAPPWPHHPGLLRGRHVRRHRPGQLLRVQVRPGRDGAVYHPRARRARHHGEPGRPRIHRHPDDRGASGGAPGGLSRRDPGRPFRRSRRDRRGRAVPRVRRRFLHLRCDHPDGWRPRHGPLSPVRNALAARTKGTRPMGLLEGKKLLVTGVLTDSSIAFQVARLAQQEGAEVVLTSFGRQLRLTQAIAKRLPKEAPVVELDVTNEEDLAALADRVREHIDHLDGVVHSIGFAPQSVMGGNFLAGEWDDVATALHVSAYSLKALVVAAKPLLGAGSAVVGLTFDARYAWPVYDWMGVAKAAFEATARYLARDLGPDGVRVNLVSAGPIRTTAAKSIPGFAAMEGGWSERAPLGWDVNDAEPTARAVAALLSDWFPATTGEIVHVDGGVHAMGL